MFKYYCYTHHIHANTFTTEAIGARQMGHRSPLLSNLEAHR